MNKCFWHYRIAELLDGHKLDSENPQFYRVRHQNLKLGIREKLILMKMQRNVKKAVKNTLKACLKCN